MMKDRQTSPYFLSSIRNRLLGVLNLSSSSHQKHHQASSTSPTTYPSNLQSSASSATEDQSTAASIFSQNMDTFYISHGSPMLPLEDIPARDFLRKWQDYFPEKPKAILAISAHWTTRAPSVSTTLQNGTIYDFYGFPRELYRLQYKPPGAPDLAKEVKDCLLAAGIPRVDEDSERGLDHGAWVPLYLMYPEADVPVCQLSVQPHLDGAWHYRLGQALQSLRSKGVLIMASGSATHNLRTIVPGGAPTPSWMEAFDDWLNDSLVNGRFDEVVEFERKAPAARKVHPTPEHFYPLLVALGAAGVECKAERIHASWAHSTLSMANFVFRAAS